MNFYGFRPYVPVAKRRQQAAREMEKLKKQGRVISPVIIEGRKIARHFWGNAWCENLERYSDYENRLPRGRTYARNGSIVDLQIERGKIRATVSGSELYSVKIEIGTVSQACWKAICKDCAGSIGSLVELLQGKLSKNVMERVCRTGDGLFPSPREIKMACSCPDWADMCKHVAAVMYGVGARLDSVPDLLFTLRGVDRSELIDTAGAGLPMTRTPTATERILTEDDVAALFGIEMATGSEVTNESARSAQATPARQTSSSGSRPVKEGPARGQPPTRKNKKPQKRDAPAPAAPPTIDTGKPQAGAAAKGRKIRAAPEKLESPHQAVRAPAKPSEKRIPSAEDPRPRAEPDPRRQNRTKAARWINSRARKSR